MGLINKILGFLVMSFLAFHAPLQAEEKEFVGFFERLENEEKKEYQNTLDQIMNMSDLEYSDYLKARVKKAFADKPSSMKSTIIVDITNDLDQPEPGFFERFLFNRKPITRTEIGKVKVNEMLSVEKGDSDSLNAMALKSEFEDINGDRTFQHLEGVIDEETALVLVSQEGLVDLHLHESGETFSDFSTVHTVTGRYLPRRKSKTYSQDFLRDGSYQELLEIFDLRNKDLMIRVVFEEGVGADKQNQLIESWDVSDSLFFERSDIGKA